MVYKILHLPTATYVYRSFLGISDEGDPQYGEFYSDFEVSNNPDEDYVDLFHGKHVFDLLRVKLSTSKTKPYFSYSKEKPDTLIDRIEYFELEEIEDGV